MVTVPVTLVGAGIASKHYRLEIDEVLRITGTNGETERLQRLVDLAQQHLPTVITTGVPEAARHGSILGFLPMSKVPGLEDPDDFEFFEARRKKEGYFTTQTLVPNQLVNSRPDLRDLVSMPPRQPITVEAAEAASSDEQYPVESPKAPKPRASLILDSFQKPMMSQGRRSNSTAAA